MKKLVVPMVMLINVSVWSQYLQRPEFAGLNAYTVKHADVFALNKNQGALAQLKIAQVGIIAERRFLLSELNNYACFIAVPTSSGNFGITAVYSGFPDFNESVVGISYARKLGTKLDLGLQLRYNGINIATYGSASAFAFELGTVWHISETLHTGLNIANPVATKFGKQQDEKYPLVIRWGVGLDASEKLLISAEIEKEEEQPVNINASVHYKFIRLLQLKFGLSSSTSSLWIDLGIKLGTLHFDFITAYHPQLGVSPALSVLYLFNKKKIESFAAHFDCHHTLVLKSWIDQLLSTGAPG